MKELFEIQIDPSLLVISLRCFTASLCGTIIGIERAYRAKPAGVRTHMLISLGSCLFMVVSTFIAEESRKAGFTTPDPARIAAQVVTGIGFLGAGAIIRNKGFIRGMTSAATIWCMSAIGLACGAGMLIIALSSTISIVLILHFFDFFEKRIHIKRFRILTLNAIVKKEGKVRDVRELLRGMDISLSHERVDHIIGEVHYHANLLVYGNIESNIESALKKLKGIKDVILLTPGDLWEG